MGPTSPTSLNRRLRSIVQELVSARVGLQQAKQGFEREYIIASLKSCDGNLSRTANHLSIHRNTLRLKMQSLDIDAADFRGRSR